MRLSLITLLILIGFEGLYSQAYTFEEYTSKIAINSIDMELIAVGVLYETNLIRAKYNVNKLSFNKKLNTMALLHSEQMNVNGFFNHVNPYDKRTKTLIDRSIFVGYLYEEIGENIYYSYIDKTKATTYEDLCKSIVSDLFKSKEHRKNILNKNYNELGIGVELANKIDPNYIYFYLTQDFGKQRGIN